MDVLVAFLLAQGIHCKLVVDSSSTAKRLQEKYGFPPESSWSVADHVPVAKYTGIEDLWEKADFESLLKKAGFPVHQKRYAALNAGAYIRKSKEKPLVARYFFENVESLAKQISTETKTAFRSLLSFCGNEDWHVF